MTEYPQTDVGNAKRFVDQHKENICYCAELGGWFIWDGRYWQRDTSGRIVNLVIAMVSNMLTWAINLSDETQRKAWVKFALQSQSHRSVNAIVDLAKNSSLVACNANIFNRDRQLLCVQNGVINLCTGEFREHRRNDMITLMANITYNPAAKCPLFDRTILLDMCGDTDLVEYTLKAIGYSLTGYVYEHKIFIPYGGGGNGKSMFFGAIRRIFSPYVITAQSSLLVASNSDRHPTELADLYGARMVLTWETNRGVRFDEAKLKQITGGDAIRARYLYKDSFEFEPTHTVWLGTNNRVILTEINEAMCRRLIEIPFKARFKIGEPGTIDRLDDILVEGEASGILNRIIKGAMDWFKNGLITPQAIQRATSEYISEMDVIKQYLDECTDTGNGYREKLAVLYKHYKLWVEENQYTMLNRQDFKRGLLDKGCGITNVHHYEWVHGLRFREGCRPF